MGSQKLTCETPVSPGDLGHASHSQEGFNCGCLIEDSLFPGSPCQQASPCGHLPPEGAAAQCREPPSPCWPHSWGPQIPAGPWAAAHPPSAPSTAWSQDVPSPSLHPPLRSGLHQLQARLRAGPGTLLYLSRQAGGPGGPGPSAAILGGTKRPSRLFLPPPTMEPGGGL